MTHALYYGLKEGKHPQIYWKPSEPGAFWNSEFLRFQEVTQEYTA